MLKDVLVICFLFIFFIMLVILILLVLEEISVLFFDLVVFEL